MSDLLGPGADRARHATGADYLGDADAQVASVLGRARKTLEAEQ